MILGDECRRGLISVYHGKLADKSRIQRGGAAGERCAFRQISQSRQELAIGSSTYRIAGSIGTIPTSIAQLAQKQDGFRIESCEEHSIWVRLGNLRSEIAEVDSASVHAGHSYL